MRVKANNKIYDVLEYTNNKKEIEDFIYGIEDSLMRQIFEWRHIKGNDEPSWQFIAFQIKKHDESYPRRKYKDFIKKLELAEFAEKSML